MWSEGSTPYLAFVPEGNVTAAVDRLRGCGKYIPTLDTDSLDAARLYLRVQFPGRWDADLGELVREAVTRTVECTLWNASYGVNVKILYPGQLVSVESLELHESVSAHNLRYDSVYDSAVGLDTNPNLLSYGAVMEAFGRLLVGSETSTIRSRYFSATQYMTTMLGSIVTLGIEDRMEYTLEKLFQDITLSLLSSSLFRFVYDCVRSLHA